MVHKWVVLNHSWWQRWNIRNILQPALRCKNCLHPLVLYKGNVSINWPRAFLFFYDDVNVALFPIFRTYHILSDFVFSLVWNAILIILLDKHNVANHTVLILTATICQVWWCIALIIGLCYDIKSYSLMGKFWVWNKKK